MSYQTRPGVRRTESEDYNTGYADGVRAAIEEQELDAYYAGVGFGKKSAGVTHLGFSNEKEREMFDEGMKKHNKHFTAYRSEPPTLFERLFGRALKFVGIKKSKKRSEREQRKKQRADSRHARTRAKYNGYNKPRERQRQKKRTDKRRK